MNPGDLAELAVAEGDLVAVWNDAGSTKAMAYPTPTARPRETFMLFSFPIGGSGGPPFLQVEGVPLRLTFAGGRERHGRQSAIAGRLRPPQAPNATRLPLIGLVFRAWTGLRSHRDDRR